MGFSKSLWIQPLRPLYPIRSRKPLHPRRCHSRYRLLFPQRRSPRQEIPGYRQCGGRSEYYPRRQRPAEVHDDGTCGGTADFAAWHEPLTSELDEGESWSLAWSWATATSVSTWSIRCVIVGSGIFKCIT